MNKSEADAKLAKVLTDRKYFGDNLISLANNMVNTFREIANLKCTTPYSNGCVFNQYTYFDILKRRADLQGSDPVGRVYFWIDINHEIDKPLHIKYKDNEYSITTPSWKIRDGEYESICYRILMDV
jgi:hypothetical protein